MLGVRMMEYSGSNKGINNRKAYNDDPFHIDKEPTLLVRRNDPVPDRIRRKDFVKAKSCVPDVTRFEISTLDGVVTYVYDENTDCMVRDYEKN